MSSAQNHRSRSRRGYKLKKAAFTNIQRSNYMKQSGRQQMQQRSSVFATLLNLFRKKQSDK